MKIKYKAKKNCTICDGTGYFTTAFDFTYRCDCYKETKKWKNRKLIIAKKRKKNENTNKR